MTNLDTLKNRLAYALHQLDNPTTTFDDFLQSPDLTAYQTKAKKIIINLLNSDTLLVRIHPAKHLDIKNSPTNEKVTYRLLETTRGTIADQRTFQADDTESLTNAEQTQIDSILSRLYDYLE